MKRLGIFIFIMILLLVMSLLIERLLGGDRPWFNTSRHLLLGMCAGWGFIVFWETTSRLSYRAAPAMLVMMMVIAGSAIFGVLWEIFEYTFNLVRYRTDIGDPYVDTIKDLAMDVAGGAIMALLFCKKKVA